MNPSDQGAQCAVLPYSDPQQASHMGFGVCYTNLPRLGRTHTHIYKECQEEEKEKGTENILKAIMAEKFQNLGREIDVQSHEAQRSFLTAN